MGQADPADCTRLPPLPPPPALWSSRSRLVYVYVDVVASPPSGLKAANCDLATLRNVFDLLQHHYPER